MNSLSPSHFSVRFPGRLSLLTFVAVTLLALLPSSHADDGASRPDSDVNTRTPVDVRRIEMLHMLDSQIPLGTEDTGLPGPNLQVQGGNRAVRYQEKVLAILALVDAGEAPATRVSEANRLLRYSLHKWPVSGPGDLCGQYARVWNHHSRTLAMRIYCLYENRLDEDILTEYRKRLDWLVGPPLQRSSENIRFTNNSAYLLAHEAMDATDRESYGQVKQWLLDNMRHVAVDGPHEWGRNYLAWTIGSILNLAEFSRDEEVRRMAMMVVDHYLALVSGFVVSGNYGSSAIRMWKWTLSPVMPQTAMVRTLFPETPPVLESGLRAEWIVSNYQAPDIVARLFSDEGPAEARITTGREEWRHHVWRGDRVLIATHQAIRHKRFNLPTGGTHGILGVFVQSGKSPRNCAFAFGCSPMTPPAKQRNLTERYFGYQNVGFAHHGGVIQAIWAGGARTPDIPVRLFHAFGFERVLEQGWAFLTDGDAYVAWRPTRGEPVDDPDASSRTEDAEWGGRWLRSTHLPGPEGEVSIIEVGDAASFGSYEAFRRDVLARNPSPVWEESSVLYRCRDGSTVEFGADTVQVDGAEVSLEGYPRAEMPGVRDYTISHGEEQVRFDFQALRVEGALPRPQSSLLFGHVPIASQP